MGTSYKKIFVSLDGTEQQQHVLERAVQIASNHGAELYVGHVIDSTPMQAAGTYPATLIPSLEKAWKDSIAEDIKAAEADGRIPSITVDVKAGRIRETLHDDFIDEIKPDLVICGARGLSNIKYAILGSISTYLVRSCPCDVLIVK
ncbi:MAG: universal stress protein [Coriobacteriia bacterium]|nr:universal stress protein [Coriobacteriia bacterium]MBS5478368.1 universal stress protein [Coriobacteriia bacterium]